MKIRKLHINKSKVLKNFDLDLTYNDKVQNLIVIAGINGSGKTTLFEYINNFFKKVEIYHKDNIEIEIKDETRQYTLDWRDALHIDNSNEPQIDTLKEEIKNLSQKFIYFKANEQNTKNTDEIIVEFIDKLIFEQKLNPETAYKKTNNILNNLFSGFGLQLEFEGLDRKKQVYFVNKNDKKLKIEELSSGEKELLTKIFSLYLADINNSLILIDEPENSLHPIWQNRIAPIYQRYAEKNNNQIILATHSPHIVGSVHKEQIRVLIKEKDTIKVIDKFDGSYGWHTEKILLEIFRTNEVRAVKIEKKIVNLQNLIINNQYDTTECKDLFSELENTLGYDDNDLVLMRIETIKRKRNK